MNDNFDNFTQMLTKLKHTFSVIGLTETKCKASNDQVNNHTIPGYTFVSEGVNSGGRLNQSFPQIFKVRKGEHRVTQRGRAARRGMKAYQRRQASTFLTFHAYLEFFRIFGKIKNREGREIEVEGKSDDFNI